MNMKNKGFTLIELLIVVVILALVATGTALAVIPMYNDARAKTFKIDAANFIDGAKNAYIMSDNKSILCYTIEELIEGSHIDKDLPSGAGGYIVLSADGKTNSIYYYDGEFLLENVDENSIDELEYEDLKSEVVITDLPVCP